MGSRYYRVGPAFWSDPAVTGWTDDGRLLALYLLTCPHRTIEGLFRLPKAYAMADLQWSHQRFAQPFAELLREGFIEYDEDAQMCLIVNALRWQAPANPNQVTAAVNAIGELPPSPLISRFYAISQQLCQRLAEGLRERFGERLTEGFAKPPAPTPAPTPAPENPLSADADNEDRPEVIELCDLLADRIRANDPQARVAPESKRWRDAMRLLIDVDGRAPEEIAHIIRWSQADEFWRSNILSASKLREKFTQLHGRANQNGSHRQDGPTAQDFLALRGQQ